MDAQSILLLALLFAAVAIGWFIGRSSIDDEGSSRDFDTSYFKGLNYLINEQPDEAVDAFIDALEVNDSTIEVHFVLGQLLRRQGQADRAIRVHQNLIARTGLTRRQHDKAKFELAQDFVDSGLFDRASRIFSELAASEGDFQEQAAMLFLDVLVRENEWEAAINLIDKCSPRRFGIKRRSEKLKRLQVNLACELISQAIDLKEIDSAKRWLKIALSYGVASHRIDYLNLKLLINDGNLERGEQAFLSLLSSDVDRVSYYLTLAPIFFRSKEDWQRYQLYLTKLYNETNITFFKLEALRIEVDLGGSKERVRKELLSLLRSSNELKVIDAVLAAYNDPNSEDNQVLSILNDALAANRDKLARFKCRSCGFKGHQLHWQCPSCREWETVISVNDVGIK